MKKTLFILGVLGLVSTASYGQFTWQPPADPWSFNHQIITDSMNRSVDSNSQSSTPNVASKATLTYTPSKSRTRANLQNFVNKTRSADAGSASQMEQLFASADIMEQIGSAMSSVGLSRNNSADAFAVYWVSAWQAATGDLSTASADAYQAVAAQAAHGLSQSPEFASADDSQKQEMAEALMVQAALIDGAKDQAAGDAAQLKALGKAVRQGAEASGLDLDKMTLTEDGFVPSKGRKGADASGAVGNEEVKQASAAGSDKTLQYGLMAALGLGAAFMIGKGMKRG
jgi:hypothetical protein